MQITFQQPYEYIRRHYRVILLFFIIWGIYNLNFNTSFSGDVYGASTIPFSIIQYHSLSLDNYYQIFEKITPDAGGFIVPIGDHRYSYYPIVLPVLITPFYLVVTSIFPLMNIPMDPSDPRFFFIICIMQKIAASGLTAASVLLLYAALQEKFSRKTAVLSSFVYGFCTLTWAISSQSLWQQCLIEFLLTLIILVLLKTNYELSERAVLICGVISGLISFGRPSDSVLLIPVLILLLSLPLRRMGIYCLGFLVSAAPFLYYNISVFHSVFGGYSTLLPGYLVNAESLIHMAALLVSPNRGLFIYSPIFLLVIPGFYQIMRETTNTEKKFYLGILLSILITIGMYGSFGCWYGGDGYGPRFLVSMIPYCILVISYPVEKILSMERSPRRGISLLILVLLITSSFLVETLGSYQINNAWNAEHDLKDPANVWNWRESQIEYTIKVGPDLWFLQQGLEKNEKYQEKNSQLSAMHKGERK